MIIIIIIIPVVVVVVLHRRAGVCDVHGMLCKPEVGKHAVTAGVDEDVAA